MITSMMEVGMNHPGMDERDIALRVLEFTIAGLLKALIIASSGLSKPENVNIIGMADGLTQMLDFVCDINERLERGKS